MKNLEIHCSPITGLIYLCRMGKTGALEKVDVTQSVVTAVMQHMDITKLDYDCLAGELTFNPKDFDSTAILSAAEAEKDGGTKE